MNSAPIIIHQHTIGGLWSAGMIIFDAIKACKSTVICVLHGEASSMGTIIPQAADVRIIMPNCSFMVHAGTTWLGASLTIKQAKSLMNWENKTEETMMEIYSESCKDGPFFKQSQNSKDEIKAYIKGKLDEKEDWFLSAEETVYFGFVDGILGNDKYEDLDIIKGYYEGN